MASPPAEAVPEDSRSAPAGAATPEPAIGGAPSGSPARISSLEQAQELLAGEGLAEATELAIGLNQFDGACERPGELFDLLAAAHHLGRVRSLTLNLPGCIPSEVLARLASTKLPALRRLVVPSLGPRGAAALADCPLLAQLDELDLSNSKPGRIGVAALGRSPHLRELALQDTTLSPTDAARPLPADLEIEFGRGACHGSCPVYCVTIRGDALEYRGEQYVKVAGPIRERVDPTRIRLILASVDAFLAGNPGRRTPSGLDCRDSLYGDVGASIRVLGGGRTFVYGRDGVCPTQADQETFRLLTDRVDALLDTGRWIGRRMW